MNIRKLLFISTIVLVLVGSSAVNRHQRQDAVQAADGTAPLPPLPPPDLQGGASWTVADGTAPLPPLPPPLRQSLA